MFYLLKKRENSNYLVFKLFSIVFGNVGFLTPSMCIHVHASLNEIYDNVSLSIYFATTNQILRSLFVIYHIH